MAKGHGHQRHNKKKDRRPNKGSGGARALTLPHPQANIPRTGIDATRGPVSGAYRTWLSNLVRRQLDAVAAQFDSANGRPAPPDLFLLVPLTTRTVVTPKEHVISIQMGVPLIATRTGGITAAPDRLAIAALRMPDPDAGSAMAMFGLGQAPDMPQPELIFAMQLPAESLRGLRMADAIGWHLARLVEAGDVALDPRALANTAGEVLALLRPNLAPREAPRVDPALLAPYEGYGFETDEPAVPLEITAPPARGGLPGLPGGAFLQDNGAQLEPLLNDLRDYVIGLWPYDYFAIDKLVEDGANRKAAVATLANLVRDLDDYLARTAEAEEAALAAEGQPPAWIADETAHYREARQTLRDTRVAQELLPRLGPILFDLEYPPEDYMPAGVEGDEADGDEESES